MHRLLVLTLLFAASGCVCGPGPDSYRRNDGSLSIANDSSFVLVDIRVTSVYSSSWGGNLLRGDVLFPGEEVSVGVPCDTYDVLIVDERDRDCQLTLDLCFSNQLWVIDDRTLFSCGWGRF